MPRFRRPSPALVVALLALTVALTSSAGANPVAFIAKALNGSSIKKHSIPLSALTPAAVKQLRGAVGPRGLPGATGARRAGATKLSEVAQTCGPAPCQTATANCPAGSHATGGGGQAVGNQLLFESRPNIPGGTPTGWVVAGGAATPPAAGTVTAFAVCASP